MNAYRTPLLIGALAFSFLIFAGCSCETRSDCAPPPPVTISKPLPEPSCDPCDRPLQVTRPVETRPSRGVCWINSLEDPILLPDPPSVTLDQNGEVTTSTPTGRLQPPDPAAAFEALSKG